MLLIKLTLDSTDKINIRFKFVYRKNRFLSPFFDRLFCNTLIEAHFDYARSSLYLNKRLNLNKRLKSKLQVIQDKCI